jgi:ankyrin repeat protein
VSNTLLVPDFEGTSALMVAAKMGRTDMVKFLLRQGAQTKTTDKQGRTAAQFVDVCGLLFFKNEFY